MVAFENQTTRVFFREEVPKHLLLLLYGREFIVRSFLVTFTSSFVLSLKVPCMLLVAQYVQQTKGPPHHASSSRLQEDKNNRN